MDLFFEGITGICLDRIVRFLI